MEPVAKKSSKTLPLNYRPVFFLSVISDKVDHQLVRLQIFEDKQTHSWYAVFVERSWKGTREQKHLYSSTHSCSCSLSNKKTPKFPSCGDGWPCRRSTESFNLARVTFVRSLNWHEHAAALVTSATKKLGFLFWTRKYPSLRILYTLYVSQVAQFPFSHL